MEHDVQKIAERLDAAINFVETAHSELALDNIVVLQELQTNVTEICKDLATLPTDGDNSLYREKLNILADKMQNLEIDLRAKKIDVEREIKSAGKNKNAASAYEKAKGNKQ